LYSAVNTLGISQCRAVNDLSDLLTAPDFVNHLAHKYGRTRVILSAAAARRRRHLHGSQTGDPETVLRPHPVDRDISRPNGIMALQTQRQSGARRK
jgi:hypothetical protein